MGSNGWGYYALNGKCYTQPLRVWSGTDRRGLVQFSMLIRNSQNIKGESPARPLSTPALPLENRGVPLALTMLRSARCTRVHGVAPFFPASSVYPVNLDSWRHQAQA
jgi:hypothetical protein